MLTWEDDVEVHALRKRGWTISAIARHTGRDRKTVRDYLSGKRTPGVRARPGPDPFDPFVDYVTARLTEDPHLWARTLFDELEERWYDVHAERCGDDCEHSFEQLDVTGWALSSLRSGWCGDRFTDGRRVVARAVVVDADNVMDVMDVVRVELAIERLMAELADAITVGGCPVVDARLPIVRSDGLRWAA